MTNTRSTSVLTTKAILALLEAATAEAQRQGQPQCIVVVDASATTLAQLRMEGAKVLSLHSAEAKARTAASIRSASTSVPEGVRAEIAAATGGRVTGLPGGLPIIIEGKCLGGIGVGSGTGDQDIAVAKAALQSIGAETE